MRTILTILFIPFVAIFEIIRGVVGGILGLYDGFKSISGGNKLTPEKMSSLLVTVEADILSSSQNRREYVQEIKKIQGGKLDPSAVKKTMAELTISSLLRSGFDGELVTSNIHLVHGTVTRMLVGIDKEINEEIDN